MCDRHIFIWKPVIVVWPTSRDDQCFHVGRNKAERFEQRWCWILRGRRLIKELSLIIKQKPVAGGDSVVGIWGGMVAVGFRRALCLILLIKLLLLCWDAKFEQFCGWILNDVKNYFDFISRAFHRTRGTRTRRIWILHYQLLSILLYIPSN